MQRMAIAAVVAALSVSGLFASPALATGGQTWHVQVGSLTFDGAGPSGGGNQYYPGSISIHQGDSVSFLPMGAHTVTFNRPPIPVFGLFGPFGGTTVTSPTDMLNSGIIGTTPTPTPFVVTFAATLPAGTYEFICSLHIGMHETINVLAPSETLPRTDAENAAIAQREITRDLATAAEIKAEANSDDEDGAPTVWAGAGNKTVTNLRFFPATITIHAGQTVRFSKKHDPTEPHTVTFGDFSDPNLELIASGGNTWPAAQPITSGFLSTAAQYDFYQLTGTPLPVAVTTYSVRFTQPGTYQYICGIHDEIGMRGTVVVLP